MTGVLADGFYHHDLGDGGWIMMGLGMLIFWGALIVLVVWAVRGGLTRRDDTPQEILRRRLADGSIGVEEYEQRRAALNGAGSTGGEEPRAAPPAPGAV